MNKYLEVKEKHRAEVNDLPMFFAFGNTQFEKGMKSFDLTLDDTDKIISIGAGGYIKRTSSRDFVDMINRHGQEIENCVLADSVGDGFIRDMFYYELNNHEYSYTRDIGDTLEALDLSVDTIIESVSLSNGLELAIQQIKRECQENER